MRVTLKIFRYDMAKPEPPRWQEFQVECASESSVLDLLNDVKWHQDGSLTFRRSCNHGMCGSCAMNINGTNKLACQIRVQDLGTDRIKVAPLPSYPVVKDLVVDMERFYENLGRVRPYFINDEPPPEKERLQSPEEQTRVEESTTCILCGACTSSCPSFWAKEEYLGPAALLKAYRFVFDSRDRGAEDRLRAVNDAQGVWRCHTIFNCMEACPKEINITDAIGKLKTAIVNAKLG